MASSEISHVLFRKEDGWTPTEAKRWLKARGVRSGTYDTMNSKGGSKLKRGSYYVFRALPKRDIDSFSSFGYSAQSKQWPGVWFKFGGHRASEDCGCI